MRVFGGKSATKQGVIGIARTQKSGLADPFIAPSTNQRASQVISSYTEGRSLDVLVASKTSTAKLHLVAAARQFGLEVYGFWKGVVPALSETTPVLPPTKQNCFICTATQLVALHQISGSYVKGRQV
jgi:hypothetical protein